MSFGSLAVVEEWLDAVNRGDAWRAGQLSAGEVEIAGPRGSMRGRQVLAAWMGWAGFSAESLRWFCGGDGSVVVEQAARWIDPATGADRGQAQVASFSVSREEISPVTRAAKTWSSRSRRRVLMKVMR